MDVIFTYIISLKFRIFIYLLEENYSFESTISNIFGNNMLSDILNLK